MLRFALGGAERVGLGSPGERAASTVVGGVAAALATAGAGLRCAGGASEGDATGGALSVAALGGCAAAPGAYTRAATEAKPRTSPAAAAATIVQRERTARCDSGPFGASDTLDTNGASLSGEALGGGSESRAVGALLVSDADALLLTGVGIARNVIFSFAVDALGAAGSLAGGGGGKLERRSGMCSDSGASPPRTTTACRGGDFKPGRAMKPPRGVTASLDKGESRESSSGG